MMIKSLEEEKRGQIAQENNQEREEAFVYEYRYTCYEGCTKEQMFTTIAFKHFKRGLTFLLD